MHHWVSHAKWLLLLIQLFDIQQDKFHWNQAKSKWIPYGKGPIALKTKILKWSSGKLQSSSIKIMDFHPVD